MSNLQSPIANSRLPLDYFDDLIRRWRVVLAMPLLAALAAALYSFAQPATYEATAIIALAPATLSVPTSNQAPPYYLMVESPRQLPPQFTPAYYIAQLRSAEVVNAVQPQLPVSLNFSSSDRSLIEITARGGEPKIVSATANRYAEEGALYLLKLLIPAGDQADTALKRLQAAEQTLARFSQDNGLGEYDLAKLRGNPALAADKKTDLARLLRERDVAESIYLEFAREQARARILAITTYKPNAIPAPVPIAPNAPRTAQNILVGAGLGLLVGVFAAFALEYVRK